MPLLNQILKLIGLELDDLSAALRRDVIFVGMTGALLLVAVIFLMVALYVGLADAFGPMVAALGIALGALVLALIVFGIRALNEQARKRREQAARKATERTALITSAALTALPMLLEKEGLRKIGLPLGGVIAAAWLLLKSGEKKDGPAPD
jgi:uncharacterized membrane protein